MILLVLVVLLFSALPVQAMEAEIYEQVDADALMHALPEETQALLRAAGVSPNRTDENALQALINEFSIRLREAWVKPAKVLLKLLAMLLLTRMVMELAPKNVRSVIELCGTVCTSFLLFPVMQEMLSLTNDTVRVLSGFLAAAVPVYVALMLLSGHTAVGATYGSLTLGAANGISVLVKQLFLPLLRIFFALTSVSAAAGHGLEQFTDKLYKCVKWILTLTVSVFTGVLSLQTVISAQTDAVTGKAVKMIASSTIPIVGGAFGDAIALLGTGIGTVKSGAGAFGILAAVVILLPLCLKIGLWVLICEAALFTSGLLSLRGVSTFLNGCSAALKMLLALLFSTGAAAVLSAAVVLCVRGTYG